MTGGTEDLEHTTTSDGDTPAGGSAVPPEESPDLVQTPLDDQEILDLNRRFAEVRRSVGALEKVLLQGPRKFSRRDLSLKQDIPERLASVYWRSLGFTPVDEDTVVFTEEDAYAIGDLTAIVEDGVLSERAFSSITRGLGFHMGRLAMWITEALVDEAKHADGADDAEARQQMLDSVPELLETLESQVMFTFRRQLAAYAARAGSEVLHRDTDELFPLQRAVGFADLVQFTRLAQDLSGAELADVVGRFEAVGRDVISVGGGRVVKTVGDEIMFLADTPEDGAQIAVSLAEIITADQGLPPVRVGLSWGSMFSRYGDVFGPKVNLAARMESVARPGSVIVDDETAEAIAQALPGGFDISEGEDVDLHGIGTVRVQEMRRDRSAPLDLGL
ncbi:MULTISPECIES: adenylate/guanylate cyclase domain-containing protein [Brachybacterium]|uniref:Adenylate/guanylate cyclase domain-containing protein n=1 Tax=Brachybacterium alimentarium TaxID=47845 RepID=A0A2A3YII9_9MICO|nr:MULTISPECIES: adenylate/guanylate cyclase domain-containing protein [Brachybacterium]PCC35650.1 adenylate/guanylate cyclase domain-containing protein [Brachybacterium alimentarium]PCC39176.1 adenylate/guanylate cyclase domain-containing protein [Brachybacterium alimentarium]RCS64719.1 adenylate/guanylate cyclase domain-containing protein [Brachybacterium sp. JB7]RCS66568.1 adenylate/guanylate cyclase domain-containing protein [Brachybacterium alimentarium]RCS67969.1 adenylate/guanylate cycl